MSYRGRIAPSPTGYLHAGHARTFWIAYQRAQSHHGTLILRNEDLDPDRSKPEYVDAMLEDLHWLGIRWSEGPRINPSQPEGPRINSPRPEGPKINPSQSEGPDLSGPYGPYAQSQRRAFYLDAWRRLVATGHVYPCTCSRKDLQRAAQAPHEGTQPEDEEPIYPGTCRPSPNAPPIQPPDFPAGRNWRFRVPAGVAIEFTDGYFGPQRLIAGRDFGDFLVWRRDDVPAYQLAVVVDDHLMRITEVVRGQDLLVSTARQILLYRALGWTPPAWYHCPLVTDAQGQRLAKRHDALSILTLRQQGQTPAQVLGLE